LGKNLHTFPLMSKKMVSMLLTMLFTCLAFLVSESLDFLCTAHGFLPERLSNHWQGPQRFCFPGSIAKSRQATYTTLNERM
jgi:hypothetical protein